MPRPLRSTTPFKAITHRAGVALAALALASIACGGREDANAPTGSGGNSGTQGGTAGSKQGGSGGSGSGGDHTTGTAGISGVGSSSTSVSSTSFTTGVFPCVDGGQGGMGGTNGPGGQVCSRPTCMGDASACPQTGAICFNDLCCEPSQFEGPTCLECTCDAECPTSSPFCQRGACNGCRTDCDCPAGKSCQQSTFSGAIAFDCR